jgi:hypothetical protein
MIKQSDIYRQNAENCMQMAEAAEDEPAYNRFKRMESAWLALAEEQDWLDGEQPPAGSNDVPKEEMSTARLQELEESVASLLAAARMLPVGQDRDDAFREIEGFRAQITALHRVDARLAEVGLKAKE